MNEQDRSSSSIQYRCSRCGHYTFDVSLLLRSRMYPEGAVTEWEYLCPDCAAKSSRGMERHVRIGPSEFKGDEINPEDELVPFYDQ